MKSNGSFVFARGLCVVAGLAGVTAAKPAQAADVGVGLIGALGGNFLDKTDDHPPGLDIYPGFGGLTMGGGIMGDLRFLDGLLGLELDVIRSTDKGKGTVTFTGLGGSADVKLTLGQPAWHVPILAKLTIPSPLVAPAFFLGPELVFPGAATTSIDSPVPVATPINATADSYVMITGGLGMEIKLPLPVLDLRIPIGLHSSYNPGVSSKFADRVSASLAPQSVTYHSEWKFAVNLTAGAALYF